MTSSLLSLAGAGVLVAGFGTHDALAQRFEYTYGGPKCVEAGRGGVQPVSEGGYIAVGETFSRQDGSCGDADIYVLRTQSDGSLAWSRSYNLGGNDYGTSIREVRCDPEGRGGFIITGYTDRGSEECGSWSDLILLRIDRCGEVIWSNTYGNPDSEDAGWDVVEACTQGTADAGTSQGDFIAAGYSWSGNGRNGYLIRVNWANGGLIWDMTYDGPQGADDYFYGLDETRFNNPGSTGDIVAAGGTDSYSGTTDAWIVRVDGNNGGFNAPLHGSAAYNGGDFEEFRSIQELKMGAYAGYLVAVGSTRSLTGGLDVYAVQTRPHPCVRISEVVFGTFGDLPDEGYWIRETPWGDLIVTGYMVPPAGAGHGAEDLFLAKLPIPIMPGGPVMLYGGRQTDWGWSVSPVSAKPNPECLTDGYIVAGFTNSPNLVNAGDPNQLYLIKTDRDLSDKCTNREYDVFWEQPHYEVHCEFPQYHPMGWWCGTGIESTCQYWQRMICLDQDLPDHCRIERCECSPDWAKPNVPSPGEIGQGGISISSYPNPVRAGGSVTLEYTLAADALVNVTVSDMSGRMIYAKSVAAGSGVGTLSVGTEGWSSGNYTVSIAANGRIASTRVVVTE